MGGKRNHPRITGRYSAPAHQLLCRFLEREKMVSDKAKQETVILNEVRQSIVRLRERALTGRHLQTAIWKIWGHCRDNQNSLDSERHCKIIEEIVQQAVVSVQKRVENLAVELDAAQAEVRELRKQVKALSVPAPSAA